ncbi:hypothetical protein ES703_111169 [subsurface metagenome]
MSVSVRGHERAVEVLRKKGPLPKGISDNITEGVPEKVKPKLLKPKVSKPAVVESEEEVAKEKETRERGRTRSP